MEKKIEGSNKDNLIVSFGGLGLKSGGIPPFEFLNHLSANFDCDLIFYVDPKRCWYHLGIEGISFDIPSTVEYLRPIVKDRNNVIFLGVSAGGFAAMLFGSLLKVNHVIAYIPQSTVRNPIDPRYQDVQPYISDVTSYTIYYDPNKPESDHLHHKSHCIRFGGLSNFNLIPMPNLDMRKLRDADIIKNKLQEFMIS